MSLRKLIRHTRLLFEECLYKTRKLTQGGYERPLELTRLEERMLFSASAIAPVVAQVAEVGGSILADAAPINDVSVFHVPDQQLLDLVADSVLPSQTADQNSSAAADEQTRELVFLDSSVGNVDKMISNLKSQSASDSSRTLEFVVLDSTKDGIAQITSALLQHNGVDGIHIVSQGDAGRVQLGSTLLSMDNLDRYRGAISAWQYSMSDKADVLFYGCHLAASGNGQTLLSELSELTQTNVAASEELSGNSDSAGDANQAGVRHEIVILDPGVQNSSELQELLLTQQEQGRELTFFVLDASRDGVEQIGEILARYQDLDAVHVLSHGTTQGLQLGSTWLDSQTVNSYASTIRGWQTAFTGDGDLLLYGCDLAATHSGRSLVGTLGQWTGTDVAASTDLTGYALFGGDWELEYQTGHIEASIAASQRTQDEWLGLMAVSVDATSTGVGAGVSSVTFSHTTTTTGDRLMLVGVAMDANAGPIVNNVTYGGQSLTLVGSRVGGSAPVRIEIWKLVNPNAGTANVVVNLSKNADGVSVGATTFTGVDQTTSLGTFVSAIGTSNAPTVNVSSAAGELVYDVVAGKDAGTLTVGPGQAGLWDVNASGQSRGASSIEAGAATVTMSWVKGSSLEWAIGGVAIKPTANNPPANSVPAAQTMNEDTAVVFSSGNGNQISISDVDASGSTEATLSVTNGTLTLSGTTGLTFTTGTGTANTTMTFRGTLANINAALNGLAYTPTANYNGSATLTLSTLDSALVTLNIDVTLKGRYTFENTGSLGVDTSPAAAFPGTVSGATSTVDGTRGKVLSLDGNSYIQTSGHFGNPANVTLAAWVNLTAADTLGAHVISLGDSILFTLDEPSGGNGVTGVYYNGTSWVKLRTTQFLAGTGWHHIAYSFDNTNSVNTIYIDGVVVAAAATSGAISYTQGANSFLGRHGNGNTSFDFTGKMDDVRVYTRALTAAEIGSLATDLSLTDRDTVAVNVTPVNDAPTITNGATVTLTGTNEDTTSSGTIVSTILTSANWADVDSGALKGIAITSKTGNGTWQYSTDGTTWAAFSAVSSTNALLITSTTQVRYFPDSQNGETATFGFMAWDQTTGTASTNGVPSYANPGGGGGTTAYSSQTATASMTITSVNDAPYMPGVALASTSEDVNATVSVSYFAGFSTDVDTSALKGLAIVGIDDANGTWQYTLNGANWFNIGSVSTSNALLLAADANSAFRFVPNANWNGVTGMFQYKAWDQTTGTAGTYVDTSISGGTTTLSGTSGSTLTVAAVNDAPVCSAGTPAAISVNEDSANTTAITLGLSGLTYGPGGGSDESGQTLTYTVASIPSHITLWNADGVTHVTASTVVTLAELQGLKYTTVADANGSGNLTWMVVDNGGTANGGVNTLTETLSFIVNAVNDAPTATNLSAAETYTEDTPLALTAIVAIDVDSATVTATLTLSNVSAGSLNTGTSGAVTSTWNAGTGIWSASGAIADVNTLLAALNFTSTLNFNSNFTIATSISDAVAAAITGTKTITGTAVNDAPTVINSAVSLAYPIGSAATAIDSALTVSDVDNASLTGATVILTSGYVSGQDMLGFTNQNGISGSWNAGTGLLNLTGSATVANYQAALRSITFVTSSASSGARLIAFQVSDGVASSVSGTRSVVVGAEVPGLWLSAKNSATTSAGTGGLTYSDGQVARFTDPNLALGSGVSNGSFSSVFDLDTFASGNANVFGLHYVNSSVIVGTTNPVTLQEGDVLLTVNGNETLGGVAVTPKDLVLFRPTVAGNYSSGTFLILMREPGNTGANLRDFALVERAMTVGGTALQAGDFLLVFSGGAYDKDVQLFRPSTMATNPTGGTLTVFVDGNGSAGIDFGQQIYGLELVQHATTLGGTSLTEGQLLIALNGNDVVGTSNLSVTDYDVFALTLTATGNGTSSGTAKILLRGADIGLTAGGEEIDALAMVANYNTAPVLADTSLSLTVAEDAGLPIGAVGSLLSAVTGGISDADSGSVQGVAITASVETNGTWYYTTNNGANWTAIGSVSSSSSLLLADNANTRLYFAPGSNYNGASTSALTIRGWDQTSGTAGTKVDTSSNDGTTAFSSATDVVDVSVSAVNDAPTAANLSAAEPYTEDTAFNLTDIVVSDIDSASVTVTLTLSNTSAGSLNTGTSGAVTSTFVAGTGVWTASGGIVDVNTLLASLSFTPALNSNSNFTIATSVSDGSLSVTGSKAMTGTAVNDAPVNTVPGLQTINEDQTLTFSAANGNAISITDVDAGIATMQVTLSVSSGTLTLNGTTGLSFTTGDGTADTSMQFTGTTAQINTALSSLLFTPTASFNGGVGIGITTSDLGNMGSGGTLTDSDGISIIVNAVNDAPVLDDSGTMTLTSITEDDLTNGGQTVASIEASAGGDRITDVDSGAVEGMAITALTNGNGSWEYSTNAGSSWNAMGSVAETSALLLRSTDLVRFVPNGLNATSGDLTFRAWDQTSGTSGNKVDVSSNGGITAFTSSTETAAIIVTAVNDAPVTVSEAAPAIEAGGTANGTSGVNPAGNVLANDTDVDSGDTLTISGVAAGTVASASGSVGTSVAGLYGSITIAADGTAAYTVDNSNATVQALRTSSDTLTEVFSYTIKDAGGLTSTTQVTLTIQGANDTPHDMATTGLTVAENASNGANAGTITRSDVDGSDTPTYSLVDSAGGRFAINSSTGVVTVANSSLLNYELAISHDITVRVTDLAGATYDEAFIINLTDVNEFNVSVPTDINATANAVNENVSIGTLVGITASASDADGTTNGVTYSLFDNDGGNFAIDTNTGIVTTAAALNRETLGASRNITVRATSTDGSTADTVFTININDLDEFDTSAVIDSNATANSVAENASNGTVVGITGLASDADATTNTITHSLDSDAGGRFTINSSTGIVTVADGTLLNYEAATSHNITVRATSADTSFSTQTFTINLTDVNEAAVGSVSDSNAAINSVLENSSNGTSVAITGLATDPDGTDIVTYSLDSNAGGRFAIDTNTGVVTVSGAIDRETAASYNITIRATSTDTSFSIQNFTINVGDVDEFDTSSVIDSVASVNSVVENAATGTTVGLTASASDADATTNTVTYSLQNSDGGRFAIDANTGVLTVAGAIDREADGASRNITVRAISADGSFTDQVFSIAINDIDEFDTGSVTDSNAISNAVNENAANGTVVGIVANSFDGDATTNAVTYTLDDNAGGRFAIDSITGVVTVANGLLLDRESAASHSITVRATSSDSSTQARSFTIDLIDLNDTSPVITSGQQFSVSELATVGTVVGDVLATDADSVGTLQGWTITGGDTDGVFAINPTNGRISVADVTRLDFESTGTYTLTLIVSDGVSVSSSQSVSIRVVDQNEAPVFAAGPVLNVNENSLNGTVIGGVAATDPDAGDALTYAISSSGPVSPFAIDGITGQIRVIDASLLNFEVVSTVTLNIRVTDATGLTDTQAITVTINDVNETPTDLVLSGGVIAENSVGGTIVATASGSDPDVGEILNYALVNDGGGRFVIDTTTGIVRVAAGASLNFEASGTHLVTIRTTDAGGLSYNESFTITVTDVNDAPVATDDSFTALQLRTLDSVSGVLVNDRDEDGQTLTAVLVSGPLHGTLVLNADGSFSYLASGAYSGFDSFHYQVSDGTLSSNVVSVTIDVLISLSPGGGSGSSGTSGAGSSDDSSTDDADTSTSGEGAPTGTNGSQTPPGSGLSTSETRSLSGPRGNPVFINGTATDETVTVEYITTMIFNPGILADQLALDSNRSGRTASGAAARILTTLWNESGFLLDPADALISDAFFAFHHTSDAHGPNSAADQLEMANTVVIGSTAVVSTSLSVGYVIWIIRGGSLLSAFMSAMPAWQSFDPLPILPSYENEKHEDDESLLGIVTRKAIAPLRGKSKTS